MVAGPGGYSYENNTRASAFWLLMQWGDSLGAANSVGTMASLQI